MPAIICNHFAIGLISSIYISFIYRLIYNILEEFITVHVKSYKNHSSVKINFVGSVAFYLKDEIEFLMKKYKIKLGDIIKDPIYNLVKYHSKNINNY